MEVDFQFCVKFTNVTANPEVAIANWEKSNKVEEYANNVVYSKQCQWRQCIPGFSEISFQISKGLKFPIANESK